MSKKQNKFQTKIKKYLKRYSPKTIKTKKVIRLTQITIVLMALVYFGEQAGDWFKASVLETPQPFNGTVMPVSKVPHWTHWHTQNTLKYDQISADKLIDLPPYDLSKMQFPNDQLIWGDSSQDDIRSTKITYPVVYLGNYKLDHNENVGSHLAIDIKMPTGTPLHAIANGKVVKKSIQSTGFGNHVVIKHTNVPDPQNPGRLTTLYSAFSHMDRVDVVEGQNVLKSQIIGTSGNTGTSTTPHLHFQIDRDSAPWHPYWPFSWKESQAAGLSFFEAVNAGLGISKGRNNTVHPMKFVTQNLGYNQVASNNNTGTQDTTNNDPQPELQPEPVNTEGEEPVLSEIEGLPRPDENVVEQPTNPTPLPNPEPTFTESDKSGLFTYKITGESVSLLGNAVPLVVVSDESQLRTLNEDDPIYAEVSGVGKLQKKKFTRSDFVNNTLKLYVKSDEMGTANIMIGKSSFQVNFIDQLKGVTKFHIEHDGYFQKSVVETVKIIALDEDGNIAPNLNFSGIVTIKAIDGLARIIPEQITSGDFKNGVAEIKIIVPNEDPVKLRAQNGALVGESNPIRAENKIVFADVGRNDPNYEAIKYLKDHDIVSGYSDGTFKPDKTVNRAEALKMLMLAFNVDVGGPFELNFADVDKNAWYASTLSTAVARGIVKGYNDGTFKPANTVNRAEYLKILFATNNIKPDSEITQPYNDVSLEDWFAGYAFLANKMSLLDSAENLNPGNGMTRAGVAKTIYRMKMIQENDWVAYSK